MTIDEDGNEIVTSEELWDELKTLASKIDTPLHVMLGNYMLGEYHGTPLENKINANMFLLSLEEIYPRLVW